MTEPRSIAQAAVSLAASIDELIRDVDYFRRQVIEARAEMNDMSHQLESIKSRSENLAEYAQRPRVQLPPGLDDVLSNCHEEVENFHVKLQEYDNKRCRLGREYVWSERHTIIAYRNTLTAHEGALKLAIDVITLSLVAGIRDPTTPSQMDSPTLKTNIEQTISEIARLQAQVTRLERQVGANYIMKRYLQELTSYAGSVMSDKLPDSSPISSGARYRDSQDIPGRSDVFSTLPSNIADSRVIARNRPTVERNLTSPTPGHNFENDENQPPLSNVQPLNLPVEELKIGLALTPGSDHRIDSVTVIPVDRDRPKRRRTRDAASHGTLNRPPGSSSSNEERTQLERISTETAFAKQKREAFIHELMNVPESRIAPKFGSSYHLRTDYKRSWLGLGTVRRVGGGTHAENIRWFKAFTMTIGDSESEFGYSGNRIDTTSAIVAAISIQDSKWLDQLLKSHVKLDRRDLNPCTGSTISVLDAAMDWNVSIAKKLIKAGLEPKCKNLARVARLQPDQFDMPTLDAQKMLISAAKFLLDTGAPIDAERRPSYVEPPLHATIQAGNTFMARFLLEHGASTEQNILNHGTPLHLAITFNHFDIATMVFNAPQTDKKTVLQCKAEIARFDSRSKNWRFWGDVTPLELAKKLGKLRELSHALELPLEEDEQLHIKLRALSFKRDA